MNNLKGLHAILWPPGSSKVCRCATNKPVSSTLALTIIQCAIVELNSQLISLCTLLVSCQYMDVQFPTGPDCTLTHILCVVGVRRITDHCRRVEGSFNAVICHYWRAPLLRIRRPRPIQRLQLIMGGSVTEYHSTILAGGSNLPFFRWRFFSGISCWLEGHIGSLSFVSYTCYNPSCSI